MLFFSSLLPHFCCTMFISLVSSGWFFLAPSTMWRLRCFPAALLSRCCPVQPRSGRWRRSWLPHAAWRRVRLWARCWHIDASRLASPGWCTGQFPGHTAQTLWVHAAPTAGRSLFFFSPPSSPASCLSLPVYLSLTGSGLQGSNERGRNHPQWAQKEIHWYLNLGVVL